MEVGRTVAVGLPARNTPTSEIVSLMTGEAELRAVRALRPRLRRFWELREREVVDMVNALLREGRALPQLVKHDGWDYHLHATAPDAPLATRMAVEAAMGILDVVRTKELSRLRICEYPGCNHVVVDLTKNRSKRFCDSGCGNRAAVAAYRARAAAVGPLPCITGGPLCYGASHGAAVGG